MVYYHKIVSFLTSKIIDSALHWTGGGGGGLIILWVKIKLNEMLYASHLKMVALTL